MKTVRTFVLIAAWLFIATCRERPTTIGSTTTGSTTGESTAPTTTGAPAAEPLPADVPQLEPCGNTSHPTLPDRWRASALMEPFTGNQLVVADLIYDSSVPAYQAKMYGVQGGSANILVTDSENYLIYDVSENVRVCVAVGDHWSVPSQDWLSAQAECAGEAPLIKTAVQWWKTPADPSPSTSWFWYATDTRMPWRTMFASPTQSPAILGDFAMSFLPTFEAVPSTNLPELVQFCQRTAKPRAGVTRDVTRLLSEKLAPYGESQRVAAIPNLIPGLSYAQCASTPLPQWPEQLEMTSFMTPVNFAFNPFPTQAYYQAAAPGLRTRMYWPPASGEFAEDALLLGPNGYIVDRMLGSAPTTCAVNVVPGTPKMTWPTVDQCTCGAVITNNPVLSPGETTQIMTCTMVAPRVFWTWYTAEGRPVTFMETSSPAKEGTGLALADYYAWNPGAAIPPGTFDLPPECTTPTLTAKKPAHPPMHHGRTKSMDAGGGVPPQCYTCHMGPPSTTATPKKTG